MSNYPWLKKAELSAYHEAGHAVAACVLGVRFDHVTILTSECKVCGPQSMRPILESLIASSAKDATTRRRFTRQLLKIPESKVALREPHVGYVRNIDLKRPNRSRFQKRLIILKVAGLVECTIAGRGQIHKATMMRSLSDLLQIRDALGGEGDPNYKQNSRTIANQAKMWLREASFWSAVEGVAQELIKRKYMSYRVARRVYMESLGNESILFPLFVARRAWFLPERSGRATC